MRKLNLLLVEDSDDDADLILMELRRGGYDVGKIRVEENGKTRERYPENVVRVENAEAMGEALGQRKWDLVISDYVMPTFSGPAAMKLLHESGYDIPIIIVSGHIGEDIAVSAMKSGANDYVMKDRLARLVPAVERELREAEVRRARHLAEERRRIAVEQLRMSETRF